MYVQYLQHRSLKDSLTSIAWTHTAGNKYRRRWSEISLYFPRGSPPRLPKGPVNPNKHLKTTLGTAACCRQHRCRVVYRFSVHLLLLRPLLFAPAANHTRPRTQTPFKACKVTAHEIGRSSKVLHLPVMDVCTCFYSHTAILYSYGSAILIMLGSSHHLQ